MKTKVTIAGGAGFTGGELLRLLLHHPQVEIHAVLSRSQAGKPVHEVFPDLLGETDLLFSSEPDHTADVWFLCMGHGESRTFLARYAPAPHQRVIDLSQDFRNEPQSPFGNFVYGLPELHKPAIQQARLIANPGCFATAIQLSLLPAVTHGLTGPVYTTGITGSTGAGRQLSDSSHFSWRSNNIQPYKSLNHQHLLEINKTLQHAGKTQPAVHFIPWRGNFTRGIFTSSQFTTDLPAEVLLAGYQSFYADAPFTRVSEKPIDLKQVINTNKCLLHIEQQGTQVVVHAALDNLLKGACGQAVQNMNLMLGLPETTGLQLKSIAY